MKINQKVSTWVQELVAKEKVKVIKIPINDLKEWFIDKDSGNIIHKTGKFFTIHGIEIRTNWGKVNFWDQPIINQSEIGLLGIIAKKINGVYYFLLQAKIEPGNLNIVQLSPTLQATKSNYNKVHGGKEPLYLDYFLDKNRKILIDQLQSEQGARFLQKRNRNMIIEVNHSINYPKNFMWFTLEEIKEMIRIDNLINMDTRSVIAGLNINKKDYISLHWKDNKEKSCYTFKELLLWITEQKTKFHLDIHHKSMNQVNSWIIDNYEIYHKNQKYFKIIGVKSKINSREVKEWSQPMIESMSSGLISFIAKKINGLFHFIVQAKVEVGNLDIIELAPTVQCITGNYRRTGKGELPFLDYILDAKKNQIIHDTMQSEEGGRFYKEQNRNLIIQADGDFPDKLPNNYIWMTYNQLHDFMIFNNYLNIQARSLLSVIKKCNYEIN
ncbi:MAG: NDP-hexose 2,3-dehydratase family protein [Candidatus Neomarinimicrobiota bacterium]